MRIRRMYYVVNICFCVLGTSIGFKNIASKIANELKLWLPVCGPDVSTEDQ